MALSCFTAAVTAFATAASAAVLVLSATGAEAAISANLVTNPSFASGKTGWGADSNTTLTVQQNGYQATAGANLVPVAAGDVRLTDSPDTVAYTTAGATYTVTARVRNPTAGTTIRGAVSLMEQAPEATTPLSRSSAFTLHDTSWHTVSVSGVAAGNTAGSTGAHGLSLDVVGRGLTSTQRLLVDDVTLKRASATAVPTAAFAATASFLTAKLDASGSFDADGSISSYAWDYGDGTTGTGRLSSHTYSSAGTKTVTLTVKDGDGATHSTSKSIQVVANVAPSASFLSTTTHLKASLNASGSTDSDGSIVSYVWDFGDGSTGSGRSTTHTYASAGSKNVTLTVTDNAGAKKSVTKVVNVTANVAPTATFTSSSTYLRAKLEATATDTDGSISSYTWDYGDGTTGAGRLAWHTYESAGTYTVTLAVKDSSGAVTQVKRSVHVVENVPPTAVLNASSKYLLGRFNASGSTDTDGNISSYVWSFGDGSTARGSWVSHTYAAAGTYTVALTATDNGGASTTKTAQVTVVANSAPTVNLSSTMSNLTASLSGNGSIDADGRIVSYAWNFGDGATATGKTVTHTYAQPGSYVVSLTVTDEGGARTQATRTVTAVANVAPTASFVSTASSRTARFDGTGSIDSDGTITSWSWDYGDGSTGAGASAWHTYATAGTRVVTLTVTDNAGATATKVMTVAVTDGPAVALGVYNGIVGEAPDETTLADFGATPQVASSYYSSSMSLTLSYETARIRRGTSPNITMTTKGTQLIHGIATGDAQALAWLDRYVAQLATLAAVDPTVPVYATLDHEFRSKVNTGVVTGPSADPLVYAKALDAFIAKAHRAHPNIVTTYWMVGYDRAFEGKIGAALTQRPDFITWDPYAKRATDTVVSVALGDLTWIRAQSWYDDQPVALTEFGMPVAFGDDALARFYTDVRGQLDSIGISWAVLFNRERDNNHKITVGGYPKAVAAFSSSLQQ